MCKILLAFIFASLAGFAYPQDTIDENLFSLSLAELLQVKIISLNRVEESLFKAPAALYVITRQDIERSSAEQISDLFQRVPGMTVRQLSRHRHAISVRKDVQIYFSDYLVLIDNQSYYNPFINSTTWEAFDLILEDIERIEILRGSPGITYGANSATGVINFITRKSNTSEGAYVRAGVGTNKRSETVVRFSRAKQNWAYRITLMDERDEGYDHSNTQADPSNRQIISLRVDKNWQDWNFLVNYRKLFAAKSELGLITQQIIQTHNDSETLYLNANKTFTDGGQLSIRGSLLDSNHKFGTIEQSLFYDFFDLEVIHTQPWQWGTSQLGSSIRAIDYASGDNQVIAYKPNKGKLAWRALWLNHSIMLTPKFETSIGTRWESYDIINDDDSVSYSLRLSYSVNDAVQLWSSASSIWQYPSLSQTNADVVVGSQQTPTPALIKQVGNKNLTPEKIKEIQVGLRWQASDNLNMEASAFHIKQTDQIYVNPANTQFTPGEPLGVQSIFIDNFVNATSHGLEAVARYYSENNWHSEINLSFLHNQLTAQNHLPITNPGYYPKYKAVWLLSIDQLMGGTLQTEFSWEDTHYSENPTGLFAAPSTYNKIDDVYRLDLAYHKTINANLSSYLNIKNLFNHQVNWDYPFAMIPAQEIETSVTVGIKMLF